jgi:hypothetical protein
MHNDEILTTPLGSPISETPFSAASVMTKLDKKKVAGSRKSKRRAA